MHTPPPSTDSPKIVNHATLRLQIATMSPSSAREFDEKARPRAPEADPNTKAEVDSMILDYLVCLAIDQTLSAIGSHDQDQEPEGDLDWLVETIGALHSTLIKAHCENSLAQDLDMKLQIFMVATQLRRHAFAQSQNHRLGASRMAKIGLDFMSLCTAADHKVCEMRWFHTGAQFIIQAVLEDQCEGQVPSEDLPKLCSWAPTEPARSSRWINIRQKHANNLPGPNDSLAAQALISEYPLANFYTTVVEFLTDLMSALDPPILIQIERGKLGELTYDETQCLKARVGLR